MVRSRPSKTQLTNLHGSSITSSRLDSLMTKPSLPNLKLATNSVDFINFKPSQSKWVIPLWRRMPETQFLERGVLLLLRDFKVPFAVVVIPAAAHDVFV